MKILVVGLNYKTAPVSVRERLALNEEQTVEMLKQLRECFAQAEFALLSTCNRVELYSALPMDGGVSVEELAEFIAEFIQVPLGNFRDYLYVHENEDAVRHLLTVGCSLDSMVVGEPQITGQVKDCYRLAAACQSTGKVINRLFHCAFATSKEVYATTSIAQRRVSVAGVAVELAKQLFADLTQAKVVVVGAGDMGELLIKHLREEQCNNILLVNRTYDRGRKTANLYGIQARRWETLAEQVKTVDIIIAAAVADQFLFTKSSFQKIIEHRKRALLIIDIAVPRNFDPEINKLQDVFLYSVDDLAGVVQENLAARQEDIASAQEIVDDNVVSFMDWFGVSDIGPLIGKLRSTFNQIGTKELVSFLAREKDLDPISKRQLETMVNRTTNKLVHRLINSLYQMAKQRGSDEATDFIKILLEQKDRSEQ